MTVDWRTLQHAYGFADDVPALLLAARTAPPPTEYRDEPWFSLWSSLCHQGDVFSASYASVPELVAIAGARTDEGRGEALFLAAIIDLERREPRAPPLEAALAPAYGAAVDRARDVLAHWTNRPTDIERRQGAVADAVFHERLDEARRLLAESDGEWGARSG